VSHLAGFADFISKLLWIAWDIQAERVLVDHQPRIISLVKKKKTYPLVI
jgi:hypothetical protein